MNWNRIKRDIWHVLAYRTENRTLKKYDERRLAAAEMWCYLRMLRISWMEKMTNKSILDELQTRRELLAQITERKRAFSLCTCMNKHDV